MYDYLLTNGLLFDGNRTPPFRANLAIHNGRIAAITQDTLPAAQVLDIGGLAVSPGFIDIHSHSDACPLVGFSAESKLAQGVTTEIAGNCGISLLPAVDEHADEVQDYFASELELPLGGRRVTARSLTDYAAAVQKNGTHINMGMLVGHGTLRLSAMGFVDRAPTAQELERMESLLDEELTKGAFGLSLGLIYPPSAFGTTEELTALARVVKAHDGILAVHMRSEGPRLFEAVDEVLSIAEATGVHLQISHLKLLGRPQWGRSDELLARLDAARARGVRVTCDQYPYTASSTALTALMPHWSHAGGSEAMLRRLSSREGTLCDDIARELHDRGGAEAVLITGTHGYRPEYEGKYLRELAQQFGLSDVDTVIRVLLECHVSVACVYFCMDEGDMLRIMARDDVCVGSDGYSFSYDPAQIKTSPHPRSFATFPQFFQTVREHDLMPLQDAVYKATALPADILGLHDRGRLCVGMTADITVFDPEKIASRSDFLRSAVRPLGISHVFVAGKLAYCSNAATDARAGTVLLHR